MPHARQVRSHGDAGRRRVALSVVGSVLAHVAAVVYWPSLRVDLPLADTPTNVRLLDETESAPSTEASSPPPARPAGPDAVPDDATPPDPEPVAAPEPQTAPEPPPEAPPPADAPPGPPAEVAAPEPPAPAALDDVTVDSAADAAAVPAQAEAAPTGPGEGAENHADSDGPPSPAAVVAAREDTPALAVPGAPSDTLPAPRAALPPSTEPDAEEADARASDAVATALGPLDPAPPTAGTPDGDGTRASPLRDAVAATDPAPPAAPDLPGPSALQRNPGLPRSAVAPGRASRPPEAKASPSAPRAVTLPLLSPPAGPSPAHEGFRVTLGGVPDPDDRPAADAPAAAGAPAPRPRTKPRRDHHRRRPFRVRLPLPLAPPADTLALAGAEEERPPTSGDAPAAPGEDAPAPGGGDAPAAASTEPAPAGPTAVEPPAADASTVDASTGTVANGDPSTGDAVSASAPAVAEAHVEPPLPPREMPPPMEDEFWSGDFALSTRPAEPAPPDAPPGSAPVAPVPSPEEEARARGSLAFLQQRTLVAHRTRASRSQPLAQWTSSTDDQLRGRWTYPTHLRALGIQGTVTVQFSVGRDGRVSKVTIVDGSGNPDLDLAALASVPRTLAPLPRGAGRSVRMQYVFRYRRERSDPFGVGGAATRSGGVDHDAP